MKKNQGKGMRPKRKQCPPGTRYVPGRGCVKIKNTTRTGIRIMPDSPTRALVLSADRCAIILKTRSAFLNWASLRKTSPLFGLDVRKPLYLVSQEKGGITHAVGIVTAKNVDGDSKTRISLRRAFVPARHVLLKQKPINLIIAKRDVQFIRSAPERPAKGGLLPPGEGLIAADRSLGIPKAVLENLGKDIPGSVHIRFPETKKVLSNSVDNPSSEGGQHSHSLIRSEGRTMNGGEHFHILDHPEFGRLVSDIDGQHPHTLDGDTTGSEASPHSHIFGLPSGEMLRTEVDGPHDHDVLSLRTDNGGVHVHKIKVNGQTLQTLSATEEAMELGPGFADPQDDDAPGPANDDHPVAMQPVAKHMEPIEQDFEKAWQEADEWTLKALLEKQTTVQSVVLSKTRFATVEAAKEWVVEHGFKDDKVDEKPNTFRFRQFSPGRCKDGTFRNKRITRGVIAVICVPKGAETPSGLKGAGNAMAHKLQKEMQKKVIESSTVRVDSRPTGFSFKRKGDVLFAFKDQVKGQRTGKLETVLVRQRLGSDGMDQAPPGAIDAMEVETAPANSKPKELAKENLGTLVLVLEKVKGSDRMLEADAFLAVLDPTKAAPEKDCGCSD